MIPITQYLRPDGRKRFVEVSRSEPVEAKAQEIIQAGYSFECEVLTTGEVSMTISTEEEDVAIRISSNDAEVGKMLDALITTFVISRKDPPS